MISTNNTTVALLVIDVQEAFVQRDNQGHPRCNPKAESQIATLKDAVWAYDATGPDGVHHTADEVLSMSLCNLDGEFATVVSTDDVIDRFCS